MLLAEDPPQVRAPEGREQVLRRALGKVYVTIQKDAVRAASKEQPKRPEQLALGHVGPQKKVVLVKHHQGRSDVFHGMPDSSDKMTPLGHLQELHRMHGGMPLFARLLQGSHVVLVVVPELR